MAITAVLLVAVLSVVAAAPSPQEAVPPAPCTSASCSTAESQPLCAFDPHRGYKTFANTCQLDVENNCNCGTYTSRHEGPCTDQEFGVYQLKLAQNPRPCRVAQSALHQ